MTNWVQENPSYTIIGYTIFIATTTWLVSSFVIDENKINLYLAKAENAEAVAEQYKAKVSVLELEIARLSKENGKYYSWLLQEPKSIPALENRINDLEKEKRDLLATASSTSTASGELTTNSAPARYEYGKSFSKGGSFTDNKTKATIGIHEINPDYTASGVLYLPGKEGAKLEKVRPGTSWPYSFEGKDYILTLSTVNNDLAA